MPISKERHLHKVAVAERKILLKVGLLFVIMSGVLSIIAVRAHKEILNDQIATAMQVGRINGRKEAREEYLRILPEYIRWIERGGRHINK